MVGLQNIAALPHFLLSTEPIGFRLTVDFGSCMCPFPSGDVTILEKGKGVWHFLDFNIHPVHQPQTFVGHMRKFAYP